MKKILARAFRTSQSDRNNPRTKRGLRLERLEERAVPATVFWDGGPAGNGTNWLTPANWVGDVLPGLNDDAVISTGAGGAIGLTASTSVHSVTSSRTIQVTGGTLSIGGVASTFSNLTLTGGTLDAADGANLQNSSINGTNALTIASGRTLTLTSTSVGAPVSNQGTMLVFGASAISSAVTSGTGATFRVEGSVVGGSATLAVPGFTNNGSIELTSIDAAFPATLTVTSGVLVDAAGAAFTISPGTGGTRTINLNGGSRLDNQGIFTIGTATSITRNGGAGPASTNSGTISLTGGDLTLNQANADALTNTGTITVPAGRTLTVSSGTLNYQAGSTIVGPGNLALNSSTFTLGQNFNTTTIGLALNNATIAGTGTLTNPAGTTLTLPGSTVSAPLVNQGTVLALGVSALSGPVTTSAGSTIRVLGNATGGAATLTVPGLTNNGLIELTSADVASAATLRVNGGTLTNAAGGTVGVLPGVGGTRSINLAAGARLDNQGFFSVGAATAVARSGGAAPASTNSGTIAVTGGDLTLTQAGADALANNGTILIGTGNTFTISGGSLSNFAVSALIGGTFNVAGTFSFPGAAITTLAANLTLDGPSSSITDSVTSANGLANLGSITSAGRLALANGRTMAPAGSFVNAGVLSVGAGSAFTASAGLTNSAGATLGGSGVVTATVSSAGAVSPGGSPGVLTINGNVTLGGPIVSELDGNVVGSGYDQLTVNGLLTLNGATLNVSRNFSSAPDDSFVIISNDGADAITGTFVGLAEGAITTIGGRSFRITYAGGTNNNDIVLTQLNSPPTLAPIGPRNVDESTVLTFTANGSDLDAPPQTLTYSLEEGAPVGATIDPATGVFSWTPTEAEGPGVFSITVRVTDNYSTPATATQTFSVTVNEMNLPPVLTPIGNKSVNEQSLLSFTASATDADLPANALTFSLDSGAPAGATIDPITGVFNWTPTETQGPGVFSITVRVTDNGTPALSAFETVSVAVNEVNSPPVLAPIGNKSVNEQSLLSFTASATDSDLPANALTFSLDSGAPAGATINPATGVFSWIPTEAQGPGVFSITVRVTDNGTPALSAFETISVTVSEVNSPPVLTPIGNKSVNEQSLLSFTASATDPDLPVNALTFSLDVGAPAGSTINPTTGVFSWTPTEAQGPGVFSITVRVTDNGTPALSAFETISVAVSEVNSPPVLATIGNKTVNEQSLLTFTASATDLDLPVNTLTFSLDSGAPAGATITATTGVFTWTPTEAQGPGVFSISVRVTDNGTPALSAFETISVTVNEVNSPPVLAPINNITVNEGSLATFTASASDPDLPANTLTFSLDAGAPAGASIDPVTGVFTYTPPDGPATASITVRVADNGSPSLSAARTFTITVLNVDPTIASAGPVTAPLSGYASTGSFTDPGADTFSGSVNYGDGTGSQPLTIDQTGHTFNLSHVYATPGVYSVAISVVDDDGGIGTSTRLVTVLAPPKVTATQVNDGSAQRSRVTSLTLTFNTVVAFASTPTAAFTLTRDADGTAVTFTATASEVGGQTIITLTNFGGSATQFGSLADGRFTLTALATQITANGQSLDGNGDNLGGDNYTFGDVQGLFRMFGDVNGDRILNGLDLGFFRNAFGTQLGDANYLSYLDFDGAGLINGLDLGQFRTRFGTTLP